MVRFIYNQLGRDSYEYDNKKVLRNVLNRMIEQDLDLYTIDFITDSKTVVINGKVYVDTTNVEEGTWDTGAIVHNEGYTLSTEDNLDKVIELLKENK